MMTGHPMEPMGVALKLKVPLQFYQANMDRGNVGLAKEIQGELCLGQEAVPQVVGESVRDSGNNVEEVRLEGADGAFGNVMAMYIRGQELEFCPPLLFDVELVGCTALVVK